MEGEARSHAGLSWAPCRPSLGRPLDAAGRSLCEEGASWGVSSGKLRAERRLHLRRLRLHAPAAATVFALTGRAGPAFPEEQHSQTTAGGAWTLARTDL